MPDEQIQEIALSEIELVPLLRRTIDGEKLASLMQSIREVGLLYPPRLTRQGEKYAPADGYHRIVALMKLGRTSIPAIVEEKPLSEGEAIQKGLIANSHRIDNTPIEKAEAIRRLMELTGWNASAVATKLGFSNPTVSRLLGLLKLPEALREKVHAGEIGESAAYELARVEDGEMQAALASELAGRRLTRDGLAGLNKTRRREAVVQDGKRLSRVTARLGEGRSVTVAGVSLSLEGLIETLEELLGKARRARTQGVEVGTFVKMLRDQWVAQGA